MTSGVNYANSAIDCHPLNVLRVMEERDEVLNCCVLFYKKISRREYRAWGTVVKTITSD